MRCKALVRFWPELSHFNRVKAHWQFLPFYAIRRSIPDKLGGVVAMGGALILLALLPFYATSKIQSAQFRPRYKRVFWASISNFLILGWLGAQPVEFPYVLVGQISTILYFGLLLVARPRAEYVESVLVIGNYTKAQ